MEGCWRLGRDPSHPTCIFIPDSEDTKDKGTECGGKETTPVVANGKIGGSDFNAEEDS